MRFHVYAGEAEPGEFRAEFDSAARARVYCRDLPDEWVDILDTQEGVSIGGVDPSVPKDGAA